MDYQDVVKNVDNYKMVLCDLGKTLSYCKDNYKDLVGEGINTWRDFVEQPEIGLTVREANMLVDLSEWLDGMDVPLEDLNLATAKFGASKGITEPELVDDMKVLSLKDFKERHYDAKNGDNAPRTYKYLIMKRCNETGTLQKVYDGEEIAEVLKQANNGMI